MFAITSRGTGKKVGMRRFRMNDPDFVLNPADNEFLVSEWDEADVLAEDSISLRSKTLIEEQQEKVSELKEEARTLFIGYQESLTNIDGTTTIPQVDLDNYKTVLVNEFNTAKTAIQVEVDIDLIQNYSVSWSKKL